MNKEFDDYLERMEMSDYILDQANCIDDKRLRNELIKNAIRLCPENKHGFFLQFFYMADTSTKLMKLDNAIKKEEDFLLKEKFFDDKGSFWGIIETRYYMRLLMEKSKVLVSLNKYNESIKVCKYMLELNEDDNNGIRYELGGLYLFKGLLNEYNKLKEQYDEIALYFNFLDLLYYFKSNDLNKLNNQIKVVNEQNRYILNLVKNNKIVMDFPHHGFGSKEEASNIYNCYFYLLNDEEDFIQYIKENKE